MVSFASVGPDAGDGEPDPVDAGQCGDVERAGIPVAPGEVVRALREADGAQVLATRREHPDAARPHTYTWPAVSTFSPSMASSLSAPVASKNTSPPVTDPSPPSEYLITTLWSGSQ